MELRREVLTGFGVLAGLNILLALGSMVLFLRMGPAIDKILLGHESSIEAAEGMLAVLADVDPRGMIVHRQGDFESWFARSRESITLESEGLQVATISRIYPVALRGDPAARTELEDAIMQLISINRTGVLTASSKARKMGSSGAWAASLFAYMAFILGFVVLQRLQRRIFLPLEELFQVMKSWKEVRSIRRCRYFDSPAELRLVLDRVNQLLDHNDGIESSGGPSGQGGDSSDVGAARDARDRALVHLLEIDPGVLLVVDAAGTILASNTRGFARLDRGDADLLQTIASLSEGDGGKPAAGYRLTPLIVSSCWLVHRPGGILDEGSPDSTADQSRIQA